MWWSRAGRLGRHHRAEQGQIEFDSFDDMATLTLWDRHDRPPTAPSSQNAVDPCPNASALSASFVSCGEGSR